MPVFLCHIARPRLSPRRGRRDYHLHPTLTDGGDFNGLEVENDFAKFSKRSGIIIANRLEDELKKVSDKVYTRDLFARD